MNDSVGSTIEKIKLQEQDKEIKLKEKREYEVAIASLQRAIREAKFQTEKSKQEQESLLNKTDILRTQLMLEKIRRDAFSAQLHAMNNELEELKSKSNIDILKVWEQRSSYCKEIQSASDKYDIWGLLIKPVSSEPIIRTVKESDNNDQQLLVNQARLEAAIVRRNKAIAERDRLKAEPDNGEEFIR
ncbi:unnamed protein product, partial [Brenthis ino]